MDSCLSVRAELPARCPFKQPEIQEEIKSPSGVNKLSNSSPSIKRLHKVAEQGAHTLPSGHLKSVVLQDQEVN